MKDYNVLENTLNDITSIEPEYDFNNHNSLTRGHWKIKLGTREDREFALRFTQVINHRLTLDSKLFDFMISRYQEKTLSFAIAELYDIGFPVDDWVKAYLAYVLDKDDRFTSMLYIMNTLRKFNEDESDKDSPFI